MTDDDIRRDIAEDPDAPPELDDAWFAAAERHMPQSRQAVLLKLDRPVVDWFKRQGRGYQARMNAVLRGYVESREREGA